MRPRAGYLHYRAPFLGVNKSVDPKLLPLNQASDAENWVLDTGTLTVRPGWISYGSYPSDKILGLYDYRKVDTGEAGGLKYFTLIKAAAALYAWDRVLDTTATLLASGMSATELAAFITVNNRVYVADGTVFKVTDGVNAYNAQITGPTAAPSVANGSAGNLTGEYDYKYTFYSSTWGQESPASPVSAVVVPTGKQVDLSSLQDSADARVDKKRIYRRKVSAAEVTWRLVAEITDDSTTTHTDDLIDNDVSTTVVAPLTYSTTLPNFRMMAYQTGVLFAADGRDAKLWFSQADQPWNITDYLEIGSSADGERITGLWAYKGSLVVFKDHSIWIVTGNSKDTFFRQKIVSGVGCKGHHSIVDLDIFLAFLGEEGFYAFDGQEARKLAGDLPDPIMPDMLLRNEEYDAFVMGVHDRDRRAIIWSYPSAGQTTNDKMYVYFYEASRRNHFPTWCPWSIPGYPVPYMALCTRGDTKRRELLLGFDGGHYGTLEGFDDNGSLIQAYWITGYTDAGMPTRTKIFQEVVAETGGDPAVELWARYRVGISGLWSNIFPSTGSYGTWSTANLFRKKIGRSNRYLAFDWRVRSSAEFELFGWQVEVLPAGRPEQ